jgi:hypothetical protein
MIEMVEQISGFTAGVGRSSAAQFVAQVLATEPRSMKLLVLLAQQSNKRIP